MSRQVANSGIGLTGAIWLILIAAKVFGMLNWNWFVVISFPIWLPFVFILSAIVLGVAIGLIALLAFLGGFLIYSALVNFKLIVP